MDGYFDIGKIIKTHGINGDVGVYPLTDDPTRFELLKQADIYSSSGVKTLIIEKTWYHKGLVMLRFKGIDNMTDAEKLKDSIIRIPRSEALPLSEDEYYISDLIGLEVATVNGESLGKLDEVLHTGANDVYVVGELMIPAIKQCIKTVDLASGRMTVSLIEGLRN